MKLFFGLYIIFEIFGTYTICRIMKNFFTNSRKSNIVEFITYIAYFVLGILIYGLIKIPIINLLSNIIMLFLLTFNYRASLKKRVLATILTYSMIICAETAVLLIINYAYPSLLEPNEYFSISSHISNKIVLFMLMILMSKAKGIKNGEKMPLFYWVFLIAVPGFTLYLVYILPLGQLNEIQVIIVIIIIFLINFAIFYLYDLLSQQAEEKAKKLLIIRENEGYLKQFGIIKETSRSIASFRHDLNDKLIALKILLEEGDKEEYLRYLSEMIDEKSLKESYVYTGNVTIDSILNVKIRDAEQLGIRVDRELDIPSGMDVDAFDMTAILGNLLGTAIEDTKELSQEDKNILIQLKADNGLLFIQVKHKYLIDEAGKEGEDNIYTDKISMTSVEKAVERNYGKIECTKENGISKVNVSIFASWKR